jgi:ribosome biogenesis GTPase A
MTIQWFPGHMAKARRQVTEKLKLIDVVIELLDARLPLSSSNPMMDEIVAGKPRLVLLNKADLADPVKTKLWLDYYKKKGLKALAIDAQSGKGVQQISAESKELVREMLDKRESKGMLPRAVRALIVGIPNVGKSSLINRLAKKSIAKTGDRPGVTKAQQWIKVGTDMDLLDTPGILWPKFEDQEVGYRLAASGAIKDELLDFQEVALFAAMFLKEHYPTRISERYDLDEIPEDKIQLLDEIGRRRGCLVSGGFIDYDKVSEIILRELRSGKLGPITLETP